MFFAEENEYTQSNKTEEELKKLTIEEDLSEYQRTILIISKGQMLQKHAIYANLQNILLQCEDQKQIKNILLLISEDISKKEDDMQIHCAQNLEKFVQSQLLDDEILYTILQLCYKMLEKWVIPVLDAWVLVFKQIIEKPIFKEIEEEVEDFILQLSDGNCGLASKYVSARMIGFFINVKKFEISSFINERFRSILSEQDEEIKKIMLSEVIENVTNYCYSDFQQVLVKNQIFQYMYDPEYNIKCLAIELVLKCPQLYSEDSREETLAQQMIGLTNLNDPQLNKFLSKNYGRIYQEFECFFQKSPEKRDQFLELYKSFSESNDEEIRENYLYNFPGFLKLIGNEFFNENKQIYLNLLLDDSSKNVNLKALQTFGEICNLLGLEKAQQQLGQTYIKLLDYYLNYDEYLESQESPEIIKQNLEQLVILMRYSKDTLFSLINKYLHYDEVQQVNDLDNYSTENQSQKQNKIKNTTSGQRNAKTRLFIIKRKSNKYSSSINLNPPIITSQNSQIFQSGNTNNSQIKVVKRTSFQIISDKQNNKNQSQEASITQQTEDENSKQQQQTNGNNKDSFSDITTTADINMNKSKSSSPGIQYNKELNSNILEKYIIFFKIIQDNLSLFNWRDVTLFIENFTFCSSFFDSQVIMDQIIPIFQKIIEVSCQQIQQVAIKCFSNLINLNVYQKQALQELKLYFQKLRFNKNYQMRCLSLNLFLETSQFYPSKMLFKELKMISVLDMCDDSVFKVVYHLTKNIDKIRDLLDQDIDCQNEILEELKDTLQALVQDENTLIKENAIKQDQIIQQKESNIYQYNKKIVEQQTELAEKYENKIREEKNLKQLQEENNLDLDNLEFENMKKPKGNFVKRNSCISYSQTNSSKKNFNNSSVNGNQNNTNNIKPFNQMSQGNKPNYISSNINSNNNLNSNNNGNTCILPQLSPNKNLYNIISQSSKNIQQKDIMINNNNSNLSQKSSKNSGYLSNPTNYRHVQGNYNKDNNYGFGSNKQRPRLQSDNLKLYGRQTLLDNQKFKSSSNQNRKINLNLF